MATEQDAVIATLDAKIEELRVTLDALRRTRAFFAAERGREGSSIAPMPVQAQDEASPETENAIPTPVKSIGMMILDILQGHGRPMHVDELMPRLSSQVSQASRATVIGTLSRYTADRKLRRVAQNTYALRRLPLHQQNTTHLPQKPQSVMSTEPSIQPGTREYECYTILKTHGAFMTLREMVDAFTQSGGVLNTPKPLDLLGGVMRQSMSRGKRIFARDHQGRFGLQEWQDSQAPLDAPIHLDNVQNNGNNVNVDSAHEV